MRLLGFRRVTTIDHLALPNWPGLSTPDFAPSYTRLKEGPLKTACCQEVVVAAFAEVAAACVEEDDEPEVKIEDLAGAAESDDDDDELKIDYLSLVKKVTHNLVG